MSELRAALVVTTIFDPALLDDYASNFEKFGHLEQVMVYVIADRKTPQACYERFQGFIWTDATRGYFHRIGFCMREWVQACRTLS